MKRMLIAKAQSYKSFNAERSSTGAVAASRNATCTIPRLCMVSLPSHNPLRNHGNRLWTHFCEFVGYRFLVVPVPCTVLRQSEYSVGRERTVDVAEGDLSEVV